MSEKFLFRVAMNRSYADESEFIIMININSNGYIYRSNVEVSERRRQILKIIMRTIMMIIT